MDLDRLVLPEVEFTDALLGDVLTFLVERLKQEDPSRPFRPSIILDYEKARRDSEEHERKLAPLREYCGDRRISLKMRDCSFRNLADFLTREAGVRYRLHGYDMVITTPEGRRLTPE